MTLAAVNMRYVRQFLRRTWPEDVLSVARIRRRGAYTTAFSFSTSANDYVVRFSNALRGFNADSCAHDHFANPEIPVPKTYLIGAATENLHFSITGRAQGKILRQLSKAAGRRAVPSLIQAFDAIHLINVDERTAARLPAVGRSAGQTWKDVLRRNIDGLEAAYRETSYSDEMSSFMTAGDLMKLYWDLTDFCPESRDLLHGDLNSSNIFVDDQNRVSAIIDWNLCRYGDFLWDVARTATVVEREWGKLVIKEYGRRKLTISNFDERFTCYMIRCILSSLPFFIKRGSVEGCLSRRRKLLQVLRST